MLNLHPSVILASIEQTTASALRRRKHSVWPTAFLAALAVAALGAVLLGVAL
jgi:hypothetical protein